MLCGADGQTAQKTRGVSTGAVLGQGVHARGADGQTAQETVGMPCAFLDKVYVPVVVHVGSLKFVEDPQLQFIYGEGQFVDKVIDVPVAGGRLQGLSSEDKGSTRNFFFGKSEKMKNIKKINK